MSLRLIALLPIVVAFGGCTRGADDRVKRPEMDMYQRTANHGPAATTIATRPTDRARLSGNMVIMTNGEEMVYVQPTAFYQVPPKPSVATVESTAQLRAQIAQLDERVAILAQREQAGADAKRERAAQDKSEQEALAVSRSASAKTEAADAEAKAAADLAAQASAEATRADEAKAAASRMEEQAKQFKATSEAKAAVPQAKAAPIPMKLAPAVIAEPAPTAPTVSP